MMKLTLEEKKQRKAAYDKARYLRKKSMKTQEITKILPKFSEKHKFLPKMAEKTPQIVQILAIDKPKTKKAMWKQGIDFTGAVEINRTNVKQFYKKSGYIKVINSENETLHVGKTINMGKVFSNYINCAKYKQAYHFNIGAGDTLLFKESTI